MSNETPRTIALRLFHCAGVSKLELLRLLKARGIDPQATKVHTEMVENEDPLGEGINIPTWDEDNILTKVRPLMVPAL